ncbi:MAG: S1 RNA-binding domain-containing protein [Cyanobacteria bacterium]|nr:S1 RNA-binding domain-containing protein [Cyanobacteriota bacterium]MDA1021350.1 S1 RNA-binding domain-containing protein [Cyanobacteriota bacterium]
MAIEQILDLEAEFTKLLNKPTKNQDFQLGQIITGKLLHYEKDTALIDIGSKAEAVLPFKEINNKEDIEKPTDVLSAGEEYEFYILREPNAKGPMILSYKRVAQARGWVKLEELKTKDDAITGQVVALVKGGVVIESYGVRGFIPASQLRLRGEANNAKGTEIEFKILELDKRKGKLICSQKIAMEEEKAGLRDKAINELEIGQVLSGEVVRVAEFGAFIDIGGIDGLLPVSEISWQRIAHPRELLSTGDKISVKILKIDKATKKISLSYKRLQPDPWTEIEGKFAEGMVVKGKVVKLAVFGVFVEIYPGVEALLPVSEITNDEEDPSPDNYLKPDDEVEVLIKKFSPYERRISLSLKDVQATQY